MKDSEVARVELDKLHWSLISILAIIWLGSIRMNYDLLFRKDAILEDTDLPMKLMLFLSGPLLILSISAGAKQCERCHLWKADCKCHVDPEGD